MRHLATQKVWTADSRFGSIAAFPVGAVMSGSTSSGPGPNCEIVAMGQNRPPALQNKWKALLRERGHCCNFLRELPAGPAAAPPINGSVYGGGRRTF
jgi:hypothetical protein